MKKNTNKQQVIKFIKLMFLAIVLFILFLRFYPKGYGTTGLRPMTHGCIGITLHSQTVHRYFPDGNMYIGGFQYFVGDSRFRFSPNKFCLGKDVFYGE